MSYHTDMLKNIEEVESIMDGMSDLRRVAEANKEIIQVTLKRGWIGWEVTTADYDASCEDGETWSGSNIERGSTPEEALENYSEWLCGEGKENFRLEIEGPTSDLEVHENLKRKGWL